MPPPIEVQRDPKKLAPWINENATFVYLGATMNGNNPANHVLMYEKFTNHGGQGSTCCTTTGTWSGQTWRTSCEI